MGGSLWGWERPQLQCCLGEWLEATTGCVSKQAIAIDDECAGQW